MDRLSAHDRELLDTRLGGELGGLLRPRSPGRTLRALSRDAVGLLLALLDSDAAHDPPTAAPLEPPLAALVLDGVLEIGTADGWISGPSAAQAVGVADPPEATPTGRLARASWAALRYAATLEQLEASALARRLYCYGRLPGSPRRAAELPLPRVVRDTLDGGPLSPTHRTLAGIWRVVPPPPNNDRWRIFVPAYGRSSTSSSGVLTHKLYVSPLPDDLPAAFAAAVNVFSRLRVPCFKVADDVAGVLRPDKLVAYLPTRERLDELADALAPEVSAARPHGVPFTAEIAGDGLLSWAVDPPPGAGAPSWRGWVSLRAAWALWTARTFGAAEPPWRYALRRLAFDGVEVAAWTPQADRLSRSAWDW